MTYRNSSRVLLCDDLGPSWDAVPICKTIQRNVSSKIKLVNSVIAQQAAA